MKKQSNNIEECHEYIIRAKLNNKQENEYKKYYTFLHNSPDIFDDSKYKNIIDKQNID